MHFEKEKKVLGLQFGPPGAKKICFIDFKQILSIFEKKTKVLGLQFVPPGAKKLCFIDFRWIFSYF